MAQLSAFISSDFAACFLIGFVAGGMVAASIALIRLAVRLFTKIIR